MLLSKIMRLFKKPRQKDIIKILAKIKARTESERITFWVASGEKLFPLYIDGVNEPLSEQLSVEISQSNSYYSSCSARYFNPLIINKILEETETINVIERSSGFRTTRTLLYPLVSGGKIYGLVQLFDKKQPFGCADLKEIRVFEEELLWHLSSLKGSEPPSCLSSTDNIDDVWYEIAHQGNYLHNLISTIGAAEGCSGRDEYARVLFENYQKLALQTIETITYWMNEVLQLKTRQYCNMLLDAGVESEKCDEENLAEFSSVEEFIRPHYRDEVLQAYTAVQDYHVFLRKNKSLINRVTMLLGQMATALTRHPKTMDEKTNLDMMSQNAFFAQRQVARFENNMRELMLYLEIIELDSTREYMSVESMRPLLNRIVQIGDSFAYMDLIHNILVHIDDQTEGENFLLEQSIVEEILKILVQNAFEELAAGKTEDPMRDDPVVTVQFVIEGNHFLMQVKDNGRGFDKMPNGLELSPFTTSKDENFGTGIGLAAAKKLIDQINGQLKLDSSETGSLLSVRLPYKKAT